MNLLFSLVSGFFSALAFISSKFSFLIWFSLIPFFFLIERLKGIRLFFYSFLTGFIFFFTNLFWIGYVTKLGLLALVIYLSLYWVIYSFLARFFIFKPADIFTLPFLWITIEFLRENMGWGFGWSILGYSQYLNSLIIQPAEVGGVKIISWLIILCNVVLKKVITRRRLTKEFFIFLIIFASFFLYSLARLDFLKKKKVYCDKLKVALVQPNISQEDKWDPQKKAFILKKLKRLAKESPKEAFLIYPEASYPFILREDTQKDFKRFLEEIERDVVLGVIEKERERFYNGAILANRRGEVLEKYRKIKLVPFGEYIPLRRFFSFIPVINSIGDFSAGEKDIIFKYRKKRFSVIICFEDLFPLYVAICSQKSEEFRFSYKYYQ